MKKVLVGIYGAGGFGQEVVALLNTHLDYIFPQVNLNNLEICFIDDHVNHESVMGIQVLRFKDYLSKDSYDLYFNVAISDPIVRKKIVNKLNNSIAKPLTIVFRNVTLIGNPNIGLGSILMPNSIISNSVNVGSFTHINFGSYIAHDSKIGDYVTISPGVICCGNTIIKNGAFIGAGATIKQGTFDTPRYIGDGSILGIGSNLVTNLPDYSTYTGNPASEISVRN